MGKFFQFSLGIHLPCPSFLPLHPPALKSSAQDVGADKSPGGIIPPGLTEGAENHFHTIRQKRKETAFLFFFFLFILSVSPEKK